MSVTPNFSLDSYFADKESVVRDSQIIKAIGELKMAAITGKLD